MAAPAWHPTPRPDHPHDPDFHPSEPGPPDLLEPHTRSGPNDTTGPEPEPTSGGGRAARRREARQRLARQHETRRQEARRREARRQEARRQETRRRETLRGGTRRREGWRRARSGPVIALVTGVTALAAGCAWPGPDDPTHAGVPRDGGTLRVVGSSDVEHLDPASASSVGSRGLDRTFARTLFGTVASNTFAETVPVHPDVAERLPTRANGGISADGLTYTVRLRGDAMWDTKPPRPVTARDFVRGFKRLCNPASPSSGMGYFTATLRGMDAYCRGYMQLGAQGIAASTPGADGRTAAAFAAYQNGHGIEGVRAKDSRTLVFRLVRPASDFLNLLTLGYTAAAPQEYDAYVPDGPVFRQHTVSDGPYRITEYRPNTTYLLTRNPAWRTGSDPLREQHVDRIRITLGQDSPEAVQQQLELGTADLAWDQPVPTSALPRLRASRDARFAVRDAPSTSPYLVFNLRSPNNGRALANRNVRRALAYAVDRSALVKIVGGPDVARPLHTVIPPGTTGYAPADPFPTPGDSGDPATCRRLLASAGYPRGLTLRFPYRVNSVHKLIAESLHQNLAACGVQTVLTPDTAGDFYGRTLSDPQRGAAGQWDIAAPGWTPDWYGTNGRSVLLPLLSGRTLGPGSTNYGGYADQQVDDLIDQALTTTSESKAADLWRRADQMVTQDAAILPLLDRKYTVFTSSRVRNALFLPIAAGYDYTRIYLAQ
ncbi:ABC transporter substrate-binding protein [Actinomadura rupiterrae]|uniref:ABC transporter substrate-binding protein n=1 Tax=Actinomadura rupiterrae TaxID=559627 RepID=UPI0020A4CA7E|nr:ABC transporter substrate-binding protein [Actinomadura rupiterrae]MCP2340537.1 peptide/nickel transport system substrate-binding protein [Actinomadura rupiterrae]